MLRNFLRNFMIGRYGPDHLNVAMIIVSLVLYLLHGITGLSFVIGRGITIMPLIYLSYAILALALFRLLSRNMTRRRAENDKFIRYWWPVRTRLSRTFANLKHRKTHRFFRCPGCGNNLRVPKGKGKLQITCPRCGERFIKKT